VNKTIFSTFNPRKSSLITAEHNLEILQLERLSIMKVKPALIADGLNSFIFGLVFVFVPVFALSTFDISLSPDGIFFVRIFGTTIIANALVNWLAKDAPPSLARRHIILGRTLSCAFATILFVVYLVQGFGNALTFIPFVVHLILTVWFGLLYFKGAN